MLWLYIDTKDIEKVRELSSSIFWLVLPSLVLFITLPFLLKIGWGFYSSLGVSIAATVVSYFVIVAVLSYFGVKL